MRSMPPLSQNRVIRSADPRAETQRQPSIAGPRSPTMMDMLPPAAGREPTARSNGRSPEMQSSRSLSPTARNSVPTTYGLPPRERSASFVQPSPVVSSTQNATGSASSVHVPARNAASLQAVNIPPTGRLPSGPFSNVLSDSIQADGEELASARISNVTPKLGVVNNEPTEPLQTRYSTGSYIAAPLAGSMQSRTREVNEAVGNAVVSSLQSRLEDVQNSLQFSQLQDKSCLGAGHASALQNGAENFDDCSEATWREVGAGEPELEAGGEFFEGEEVWVIDEFSMDVYEAAARLAERVKAAAGLAILRDGLLMSSFGEFPDDVPIDMRATNLEARKPEESATKALSSTAPAGAQGRQTASEIAAEIGSPTSPKRELERKSSASGVGEEARPDTAATLLPPRVAAGAADDAGPAAPKDVLLVGDHEMEETWVYIDGLRIRIEMLPGGLLAERDTIFEELNFLLSGLQNWEPGDETTQGMPQFLQLSEMVRFSERVAEVENDYLKWAEDKDAPPVDLGSKQHVCDWLGADGEKDIALESLRMAGARRCRGPNDAAGSSCRKLLRHELYKRSAQRCPACKKPSKRSMAETANKKLAASETAALMEGTPEAPPPDRPEGQRRLEFNNDANAIVEVEAREPALALYRGEMNSYFRALALPSDVDFAKEANTPVQVTWIDGDQQHRQVPPLEVIFLSDTWARDVVGSTAAHWDNKMGRLMPGADPHAELLNGGTD